MCVQNIVELDYKYKKRQFYLGMFKYKHTGLYTVRNVLNNLKTDKHPVVYKIVSHNL